MNEKININRLGKLGALALTAALVVEGCGGSSATATSGATNNPDGATPSPVIPTLSNGETPSATALITAVPTQGPDASASSNENLGEQIANPIAIPQLISGDMVRSLQGGSKFPQYQDGEWILPSFLESQSDAAHNWFGIGPWYPEAFRNIDAGAAHLTSHGAVGETVVVADKGGMVEFAVMQLGKHQKDGATDGEGNLDPNSAMQYTGKGFEPYQTIWVIDPDTGKQLFWPDGSPVIYKASQYGDASFAIPATDANHDVRVAFAWNMGPSKPGVQPHEIKWERGPYKTDANGKPVLGGENPLPGSVVKPAVKS
jgi:hypothetical protein